MFPFALIIGIYSYSIFLLGLLFFLQPGIIAIFSILFFVILAIIYKQNLRNELIKLRKIKTSKIDKLLLGILLAQLLVNLIGALGPELAFDALWYHLTFPKLYLENGGIFHVPGGLLFYSTIPKLTELIYTVGLAVGNEILPKLTHLTFGILTLIALFKISRKYLDFTQSILVALLFYSNLSVAWESITAYIDLSRAFFEVMALWAFLIWYKDQKLKWLTLSAVLLGLAISAKLISIISIIIFLALIFTQRMDLIRKIKFSSIFILISLFIASPWFAFSFTHTGNPIFPLITNYETGQDLSLLSPVNLFKNLILLFTRSADPISPFYLISIPLIIIFAKKIYKSELRVVLLYSFFAILAWYLTPHPEVASGRYVIPYLPAFSILSVGIILFLKNLNVRRYLVALIIFLSLVSVIYRGVANFKYLAVILGTQSKQDFLVENLNFSFGDFYDTDGYFEKNMTEKDKVLLYGFHNLYYVDFNFIHESWAQKGDRFNYIATQNTPLPQRFSFWRLIYQNPTTGVNLYSLGGQEWTY